MFGLGGTATELLEDRMLSLTPLSRSEALALIGSLRSARLLMGYRGSPPADVDALADVLCRVARLAEDLPEIVEMDLIPVLDIQSRSGWSIVIHGRAEDVSHFDGPGLRAKADVPWSGPKDALVRIRPESTTGRRLTEARSQAHRLPSETESRET